MNSPILPRIGRRIFPWRLGVGLLIAVIGLEVLVPTPFLGHAHRTAQLAGLFTIALGLSLRAWGSGTAGRHTRSDHIEARRLVTGGPFAYVRNPIYLGSIVIGIGMSALIGDPLAYVLSALAFGILYFAIIPAEEEFLARLFGRDYEAYRSTVPRLLPRLHPWSRRVEQPFQWRAARDELIIAAILVAIYLALHFEEYLDRRFWWA